MDKEYSLPCSQTHITSRTLYKISKHAVHLGRGVQCTSPSRSLEDQKLVVSQQLLLNVYNHRLYNLRIHIPICNFEEALCHGDNSTTQS